MLAPGVPLARLVPDDLAAVEQSVKGLANGRRAPSRRPALLRARRRCASGIQAVRDRPEAFAASAALEDLTADRRLGVVHDAHDATMIRSMVVVAEDATTGYMAGLRLPEHRVVRALTCLLALELVGERG